VEIEIVPLTETAFFLTLALRPREGDVVMIRSAAGLGLVLSLTACAGRPPEIAPLVLASDQQLSCEAIEAETRINNAKISSLATEESLKVGQNVVAGIVGFFIWPAWAGLDFQNAAGKEGAALSQRNDYLLTLARDRCGRPRSETAALKPPAPSPSPIPSALASNAEMQASLGPWD
jgi:hypothetical protein